MCGRTVQTTRTTTTGNNNNNRKKNKDNNNNTHTHTHTHTLTTLSLMLITRTHSRTCTHTHTLYSFPCTAALARQMLECHIRGAASKRKSVSWQAGRRESSCSPRDGASTLPCPLATDHCHSHSRLTRSRSVVLARHYSAAQHWPRVALGRRLLSSGVAFVLIARAAAPLPPSSRLNSTRSFGGRRPRSPAV